MVFVLFKKSPAKGLFYYEFPEEFCFTKRNFIKGLFFFKWNFMKRAIKKSQYLPGSTLDWSFIYKWLTLVNI